MISTGSLKPLWDHCLELEALVHSCTYNDIYMTAGQVPETIMTGSTADISHIAEFGWYDPSYPDDILRYLGPATDIGLALTAKILQPNGQFVCRLTLRHLTDKELQSSVHLDKRRQFDEFVATHLGPAATVQDFPAESLTPDPDHFDDTAPIDPDHGNAEITPEMGDNYLSAEIMLPCGGTMVNGRVATRKRDNAGNPIGLANANPILDTRSYIVHFDNGDQTKLTANMIAESLYSQCDPDGHEYVLLDEIVDYAQTLQLNLPTRKSCVPTVRPTCGVRPSAGNCAANGKTVPRLGMTSLTSRNLIRLRLPNMLR